MVLVLVADPSPPFQDRVFHWSWQAMPPPPRVRGLDPVLNYNKDGKFPADPVDPADPVQSSVRLFCFVENIFFFFFFYNFAEK